MENSYGFEICCSGVYNEDTGFEFGLNTKSSNGKTASYECKADTFDELIEKIYNEGVSTVVDMMTEEPEPKTLEEQIEDLKAQLEDAKKENENLRSRVEHFYTSLPFATYGDEVITPLKPRRMTKKNSEDAREVYRKLVEYLNS